MSTSTLAANITTLSGTFQDYLSVLITSYWPVVLGIGIVFGVWYFIRSRILGLR